MKRVLTIVVVILFSSLCVAETFPAQNVNPGYVGWTGDGNYLLSYPAVGDGDDTDMAQNGPFAIVVFFGDEGEDVDQYKWLQNELTRWGYIVLVLQGIESQNWLDIEEGLVGINNGNSSITGAENMLSLGHISLAGHGTGAHIAAEIIRSGNYTIDGLFGLGLDGSDTDYLDSEYTTLSRPSSALFFTGTTDEVAPASENVIPYLQNWPGAWQVMHTLGANHLQYQEDSTFLERLFDGDASISESEQRSQALNHILPYLNLSLRGDDSAYQQAFNRENKAASSDSDAYIDEDLSRSRLYEMYGITSSLNSIMKTDEFTLSSEITMRDGSAAFGNVSCVMPDGLTVVGTFESGNASCALNGSMLSPGQQTLTLHISDHSFSDWLEIHLLRIGTPMELASPLPDVVLNQHGEVTMDVSMIASDPDEQEIILLGATLVGDNNSRLNLTVSPFNFTVKHIADQEWSGTAFLNVTLAAGFDDIVNASLNVIVLPVNDPVILQSNVSQQQSSEDGDNIVVDFSNYVTDPEGTPLTVIPDREYDGLRIDITGSVALIDPHMHWNGAEMLNFFVSDGVTDPITVSVPINIAPIDDPIYFTTVYYELELDEDGADSFDLSIITLDVDDDVLEYTITGESNISSVSISGNILTYAGSPNMHGESEYILNVSDGNSAAYLELTLVVNSVADLPTIAITSFSVIEQDVAMLWVISDEDGLTSLVFNITFDQAEIHHETICSGETQITCSTSFSRPNEDNGIKRIEVNVWDGHAKQWSNTAYHDYEFKEQVPEKIVTDSQSSFGEWTLPLGLGIIVLLLILVIRQTTNKTS